MFLIFLIFGGARPQNWGGAQAPLAPPPYYPPVRNPIMIVFSRSVNVG